MRGRKNTRFPISVILAVACINGAWYACTGEMDGAHGRNNDAQVVKTAYIPSGTTDQSNTKPLQQDPRKVTSKQAVNDFRISEDAEYATLRDKVFFTTSNVVDLIPDSTQTSFKAGQKVYVFAALKSPIEERVKFTWYGPEGKEILPSAYFDVEPNMGPVGFRIFSYRSFRKPGAYRVAVYNSIGGMIGESSFEVK